MTALSGFPKNKTKKDEDTRDKVKLSGFGYIYLVLEVKQTIATIAIWLCSNGNALLKESQRCCA